jgi:hypothetical protein
VARVTIASCHAASSGCACCSRSRGAPLQAPCSKTGTRRCEPRPPRSCDEPFLRNGDLQVYGIGVATKDVSGDGHLDELTWQDLGGTAGHGTYRLVITGHGSAREVFRRENDADLETVGLRRGALIIDRGITGSEAHPRSIHPGYERWRRTSYRWGGQQLVLAGREVVGLRRHIDPLGS